jgi:hypothetical protein
MFRSCLMFFKQLLLCMSATDIEQKTNYIAIADSIKNVHKKEKNEDKRKTIAVNS